MRVQTCFVVLLCLLACGCGSKKKTTDELIGDMKSSQDPDRISGVRNLQPGKDAEKVIPVLIEKLKDKESLVRRSAALKLGSFGEQARDAIPALQAARSDPDARVRGAAGKALSRIDPARFPDPSNQQPAEEK